MFAGETDCTYYFDWQTTYACVKEKEDLLCRVTDSKKHYDLSPLTRYPGRTELFSSPPLFSRLSFLLLLRSSLSSAPPSFPHLTLLIPPCPLTSSPPESESAQNWEAVDANAPESDPRRFYVNVCHKVLQQGAALGCPEDAAICAIGTSATATCTVTGPGTATGTGTLPVLV